MERARRIVQDESNEEKREKSKRKKKRRSKRWIRTVSGMTVTEMVLRKTVRECIPIFIIN